MKCLYFITIFWNDNKKSNCNEIFKYCCISTYCFNIYILISGGKRLLIGRSKGSKERDNSWGGAAVHELASTLYKGNNEEEHHLYEMYPPKIIQKHVLCNV